MMKKHMALFLAAMLAMGTIGCGSGTKPQQSTASGETAAKEESVTESGEVKQAAEEKDIPSTDFDDIRESYTLEELKLLKTRYYMAGGEESGYSLNGYGENISDARKVTFRELTDEITGEIVGYTAESRIIEKREDWYEQVGTRSRLYSAEGQMIRDWEETIYDSGVGEWIISRDYYDPMEGTNMETATGRFLNLKTGELRENVFYLLKINENYVAVMNNHYTMIGVLDSEGEPVTELPMKVAEAKADAYIYPCKGYVTLHNPGESQLYIYSPEMKLLGYIPVPGDEYSTYEDGFLDDYICVNGAVYDLSQANGGELNAIYWAESISYYDGELAIVENTGEDYNMQYRLVNVTSGEELAGPFSSLGMIRPDGYSAPEEKAEVFYGVDAVNDTIVKLDRSGQVLKSGPANGTRELRIYPDVMVGNTEDWNQNCMMDLDLNVKIPYGTYYSLYRGQEAEVDRWIATYTLGDETIMRSALINSDGNVFIDGCSDLSAAYDGRFTVRRGFYYGVLDSDGNWLFRVRRSDLENSD